MSPAMKMTMFVTIMIRKGGERGLRCVVPSSPAELLKHCFHVCKSNQNLHIYNLRSLICCEWSNFVIRLLIIAARRHILSEHRGNIKIKVDLLCVIGLISLASSKPSGSHAVDLNNLKGLKMNWIDKWLCFLNDNTCLQLISHNAA